MSKTDLFITKYNEQDYEYEIYLDNTNSKFPSRRFNINPNSIVNLTIEETLANWVTKGTLTLFYTYNVIENEPNKIGSLGQTSSYIFRNDGNDILHIRLFPKLNDLKLPVDRKHWELIYKFAIYDSEDIDSPPGAQNASASITKCKKFYFWDRWYQKMITNTMEYSTGLSNDPKIDNDRRIPTGNAMREIINKAVVQEGSMFDLQGNPLTIVGGDNNEWDQGESTIFYTAPAFASAYDSLMYVYNNHVSSTSTLPLSKTSTSRGSKITGRLHDFCILSKQRGPKAGDEGYLSLKPVFDYFKNAGKAEPGKYQIEHFYVQGYTPLESANGDKKTPNPKYAPTLSKQDLQKDTKLGDYSLITSYRFVDISPFINATKFTSKAVNSIDFNTRKMHIRFEDNSVTAARDFMLKKYVSNLQTQNVTNSNKLFLLTLDKNKENRNIQPVYSLKETKVDAQAEGLVKLLQIGLFQNTCINFRVLGSTNRVIGRFIAIDTRDSIEDNTFNNKFFGQWFIINVKHVFENGVFFNEITAVKTHRYKPLIRDFEDII
jgi:hypothetical protein